MDIQARQLRVGDLVDLESDVCAVAFFELYPELEGKWVQVSDVVPQNGDVTGDVVVSFLGAGSVVFPKTHWVRVWKPIGAYPKRVDAAGGEVQS